MAVKVGEGFGVVGDHGIEVEGLRVSEIRVGDGNRDIGPVGAEAAKRIGEDVECESHGRIARSNQDVKCFTANGRK